MALTQVSSEGIKDAQVKTADILDANITTAKVADNAVTGAKIADNLDIPDNNKIRFGTGNDLEIYHNGTNTHIRNITGAFQIDNTGGGDLILQAKQGENSIYCIPDGAVNLYYNNVKTFYTTGSGIVAQGPEGGDGMVYIYADEGDDNADKWRNIAVNDGTFHIQNLASGSWETNIECNGNGNVELYYDASKKLETTSGGATITGGLNLSGELLNNDAIQIQADNKHLIIGSGDDLRLYHDGTDSLVKNATGDLILQSTGDDVFIKAEDDVFIKVKGGAETAIECHSDGQVELYYNHVKKTETTNSGLRVYGNLDLEDSEIIRLGDGDDFQLYHAGGVNYIDSLNSSTLRIRQATGDINANFITDGAVELYYDNSRKFRTVSSGTEVTGSEWITEGTIYLEKGGAHHHRIIINDQGNDFAIQQSSDSGANTNFTSYLRMKDGGDIWLPVDGKKLLLGAGNDLQIYHDGTQNLIEGTTPLYIKGSPVVLYKGGSTEKYFEGTADGEAKLYYDGVKKFETTSTGALVSGRFLIGDSAATSLLSVGGSNYNWDQGDVPMLLIEGYNNEAPTSGTNNIAFQIVDENNNLIHRVWNAGGGNNDKGFAYYAGKVGIGTTSPGSYYAKDLVINAADEGGITIVGGTSDAQYLMFADGTSGQDRYRGLIGYSHNLNRLELAADGGATGNLKIYGTGNVEISNGNLAFASGHGIDFSATAGTGDSEILKDYEEGTFAATLVGSVTLHDNYNSCSYIKVGDLVTVNGEIRINNADNEAAVKINNLPFGCHSNAGGEGSNYSCGSVGLYAYTMNSNYTWAICKTSPGSSTLHFQVMKQSGNDSASLEASANGYIAFNITYKAG